MVAEHERVDELFAAFRESTAGFQPEHRLMHHAGDMS
jgi:hypothetical protein